MSSRTHWNRMLDSVMHFTSIAWALGATLAWGGGDFAGGLSSRKHNIYSVLLTAQFISLIPLGILVVWFERVIPRGSDILLSSAAGLFSVMGLLNLYKGLSIGRMSIVTSLTAIIANALPVLVSLLTEGIPSPWQISGFGLALVAIWLLSSDGKHLIATLTELRLAALGGLGFAGVFICYNKISGETYLWPMFISRFVSVLVISVYTLSHRTWHKPPLKLLPLIALTGLLDAAGNYCFIIAGQYGRLDIVTSVASLYPTITILLAWLVLRELLTVGQVIGIAFALSAIMLIAL